MFEVPPNILAVIVPRELSFKLLKYSRINKIRREQRQNTAKIVSEYDQEIPQSQTADKPMAP